MRSLKEWQLQDAKNRFSEVVRFAQHAPQAVTVHGKPTAVVISYEEYRTLATPRPSLFDVMQSAPQGFKDLDIERDCDDKMREVAL